MKVCVGKENCRGENACIDRETCNNKAKPSKLSVQVLVPILQVRKGLNVKEHDGIKIRKHTARLEALTQYKNEVIL